MKNLELKTVFMIIEGLSKNIILSANLLTMNNAILNFESHQIQIYINNDF